jgi:hypothetical protein
MVMTNPERYGDGEPILWIPKGGPLAYRQEKMPSCCRRTAAEIADQSDPFECPACGAYWERYYPY